jgi:hypothetical protein
LLIVIVAEEIVILTRGAAGIAPTTSTAGVVVSVYTWRDDAVSHTVTALLLA